MIQQIKETTLSLPEWYKTYATYYHQYQHDVVGLNNQPITIESNRDCYWEVMAYNMPYQFEDYAIVLHQHIDNEIWATDNLKTPRQRQYVYKKLNIAFPENAQEDLNAYALADSQMWDKETREDFFSNILTLNGKAHPAQLEYIIDVLKQQNQDTVLYHYDLLKTREHSHPDAPAKLFKGDLISFNELKSQSQLPTQPSGFFSENATWAVITDVEKPYSFIGGSRNIIDALISTEHDIYRIQPKFKAEVQQRIF